MRRPERSPDSRKSRAALLASALTLLFVLRGFGVPAHLAWAHSHELAGHAHGHTHEPRIEPEHSQHHSHPGEHEHSFEDHLTDLLAQRAPDPVPVDLALVERGLELELVARAGRRADAVSRRRPRARLPGPPAPRGPPAV